MLDQNTDRMWYVIGALVVGAGIILLANKALPEVFANVTKSFNGVVEEGTSAVGNLDSRNYFYLKTLKIECMNMERIRCFIMWNYN